MIKKSSLNLNLLLIISIIAFFKPVSISVFFPVINTFLNYLQILLFIIISIVYVKKVKISLGITFILLYQVIFLVSTIFNHGMIADALITSMRILSICLLCEYSIRKNCKTFLNVFEVILSIYIYVNFITIILYPTGMYVGGLSGYMSNWFLGFKNVHILYILPGVMFSIINSIYSSNKLKVRTFVLIFISSISSIIANSSTSIIAMFILIIFILLDLLIKNHKPLKFYQFYIIYFISFYCLVIARIQNLFRYIIVDVLNKDLTLTNRTFIWDYVVQYIKLKPIIGYGLEESMVRFRKGFYVHSYHAHNIILELLYKTGIVGLATYGLMILFMGKELLKYKNNRIAKYISSIILIFFIAMLTEAFDLEYFSYIIIIGYNIKFFIKDDESEESIRS